VNIGKIDMQYNFEWDPVKAKNNIKKHRASFEEASEYFLTLCNYYLLIASIAHKKNAGLR